MVKNKKRSNREIDPSKVLPKQMVIESIDDILYEIGLCLTSQRKHPKRTLIFKPLFVFTFLSLFSLKTLATLLINQNYRQYFIKLGSMGYLLNKNKIFDIIIILGVSLATISQMIYYYNHRYGIKPTFL